MPRAAPRSMKTASPLGQGRTSGGFCEGSQTHPRRSATAVEVVRSVAYGRGTPTTPAVAVGPGIPSSTEEGRFSRSLS